jgi:hypothetical protein
MADLSKARPWTTKASASVTMSLVAMLVGGLAASAPAQSPKPINVQHTEAGLRVLADGELFTVYRWAGFPKPVLYPVNGPHGHGLTRDWPMQSDTDDEAHDHPHHQSLWFAHGKVNGISFWHRRDDSGIIKHDKLLSTRSGDDALIKTRNRWLGPDGDLVCTEVRTIRFDTVEAARVIDYTLTLQALPNETLHLGDTKEGTMGIRTTPELRLTQSKGAKNVNGQAINSQGVTGQSVWGERAKWVNYWGKVKGDPVGVAIFDHPDNPRHPTWWHARHYGLIAANPFGISYFDEKPRGTGDMTIPEGGSLTFRYRFLFHKGDHQSANIAEQYEAFVSGE